MEFACSSCFDYCKNLILNLSSLLSLWPGIVGLRRDRSLPTNESGKKVSPAQGNTPTELRAACCIPILRERHKPPVGHSNISYTHGP